MGGELEVLRVASQGKCEVLRALKALCPEPDGGINRVRVYGSP